MKLGIWVGLDELYMNMSYFSRSEVKVKVIGLGKVKTLSFSDQFRFLSLRSFSGDFINFLLDSIRGKIDEIPSKSNLILS